MHLVRTVAKLPAKSNDFGNDELSDTAGVAERRIEDGNAALSGVLEVDLIGPNAKAAYKQQIFGMTEDFLRELSL